MKIRWIVNRGSNNKCKSTIAYRHGASSRRALAVSVDENYGRISAVEIAPPQRIRVRDIQRRSAIRVPPAKQRISTRCQIQHSSYSNFSLPGVHKILYVPIHVDGATVRADAGRERRGVERILAWNGRERET